MKEDNGVRGVSMTFTGAILVVLSVLLARKQLRLNLATGTSFSKKNTEMLHRDFLISYAML